MNLTIITEICTFSYGKQNRVQIPKVGAVYFPKETEQTQVFEDEQSGIVYVVIHAPSLRTLQISTYVPNESGSFADFKVEGGMYDRFVSDYEHFNGLSLHRMMSVIWVMSLMAGTERQHQEDAA